VLACPFLESDAVSYVLTDLYIHIQWDVIMKNRFWRRCGVWSAVL
jgi:hypothetical protein